MAAGISGSHDYLGWMVNLICFIASARYPWTSDKQWADKAPCNRLWIRSYNLQDRNRYRRVLSAMQRLQKDEREMLTLDVSSDLSYREIAKIIGTSESNVKVKIHRSRLKLRKILRAGEI